MKRVFILSLLCLVIPLAAQNRTLSIDVSNKALSEVMDAIEKQSDYRFYYNGTLVDVRQKVSVTVSDTGIIPVLDAVFSKTDIACDVVGNDILLSPKAKAGKPSGNPGGESLK